MTRYRSDGIFINRWDGSGMCYCEHCRANFKAATRPRAAPHRRPAGSRAHRAYVLWRQERLFDLWRLWDAEVRKINPDSCVIPNTGGGATSSLDMKRIGELAPTLMADRQARRGLMPPWANGKSAQGVPRDDGRASRSSASSASGWRRPTAGRTPCRVPAEIRLWVADGIANGMRPWFTKFGGMHQRPALAQARRGDLRAGATAPSATCATSARWPGWRSSTRSRRRWFYPGRHGGARRTSRTPALGWYQALIEARIPFEMVHDRLLDAEHLAPFRTLILPEHRRPVRRAVRPAPRSSSRAAAAWSRPPRPRSTTSGARSGQGLRPRRTSSARRWSGRGEGPMHNAYLRLEHEPGPAASAPPGPRGRAAHHPRRLAAWT